MCFCSGLNISTSFARAFYLQLIHLVSLTSFLFLAFQSLSFSRIKILRKTKLRMLFSLIWPRWRLLTTYGTTFQTHTHTYFYIFNFYLDNSKACLKRHTYWTLESYSLVALFIFACCYSLSCSFAIVVNCLSMPSMALDKLLFFWNIFFFSDLQSWDM